MSVEGGTYLRPWRTSVMLAVIVIGLATVALFEWATASPRTQQAKPAIPLTVEAARPRIQELARSGGVVLFRVNGCEYISIGDRFQHAADCPNPIHCPTRPMSPAKGK